MEYIDFYIENKSIDWLSKVYDGYDLHSSRKDKRTYDDFINLLENKNSRLSTSQTLNDFIISIEKMGVDNYIENPIVKLLIEKQSVSTFRTGVYPSDFKENNSGTTFNFSYDLEMHINFSLPIQIREWKKYFNRYSIAVTKEENNEEDVVFKSWDKIEELSHATKDAIIIDNYICANHNLDNLFSIIKELLSNRDSDEYINLLVVASKLYYNYSTEEEEDLSIVYNRIRNYIDNDINQKNVNFSFVKINTSENHDRHIFTNYYSFKAGNSFNFIDSKTKQIRLHSITDFEVIPHTSINRNDQTYAEYYSKNHLRAIRKLVVRSDENNCIGNKKSRLLGLD